MSIIRYVRSAATVSWIDARTGLPEVDRVAPGMQVSRAFLTGASGFRFVNFMEIWANYDTERNTIVGHGFTPDSGIYTSPSYAGIPSVRFPPIRNVRVGSEPVTFTQIIGARTESPEKLGGMFGPLGNIIGGAVKSFPPIWTEIRIQLYGDGNAVATVLRHSLFPSMTFYTRQVSSSLTPEESGPYTRTSPGRSAAYYDGMPNYDRWYENGWGPVGSGAAGPVSGNPWNYQKSVFNGIDPSQPFGW